MQPQTKQSDISQKGHIKYHRRCPIYPVNQRPIINNNRKVHSSCYWWNWYPPVIQRSLPQWGSHRSFFVWQKSLQTLRVDHYIDMKCQVKTYSGAQRILQLWCAHIKTIKYWKWWTRVKECWGGIPRMSSFFITLSYIQDETNVTIQNDIIWYEWFAAGETSCKNASITYFTDRVDNSILDSEGNSCGNISIPSIEINFDNDHIHVFRYIINQYIYGYLISKVISPW